MGTGIHTLIIVQHIAAAQNILKARTDQKQVFLSVYGPPTLEDTKT